MPDDIADLLRHPYRRPAPPAPPAQPTPTQPPPTPMQELEARLRRIVARYRSSEEAHGNDIAIEQVLQTARLADSLALAVGALERIATAAEILAKVE